MTAATGSYLPKTGGWQRNGITKQLLDWSPYQREIRAYHLRRAKIDKSSMRTPAATTISTHLLDPASSPRRPSRRAGSATPRSGGRGPSVEYDTRLDGHQQTYALSPRVMDVLKEKVLDSTNRPLCDPEDKIGFHGPRRPLLVSYPTKPKNIGKAVLVKKYRVKSATAEEDNTINDEVFSSRSGQEVINLAYNLRTQDMKEGMKRKKLPRPKTVPPSPSKAVKLAKEKGFILDGIALSSLEMNYGKSNPKCGPAIPPYNAHFDKQVKSYFKNKGVKANLRKTGQTKARSESTQGEYVDRFHYEREKYDYISRRNRSGAGYSRELLDGHDQFLSEVRPLKSYNGPYGFRRNTPTLRHCPSPFGPASRSSYF